MLRPSLAPLESASSTLSEQADTTSRRRTALALLVAGAFFMENLDGTVIATALPQMASSFGVEPVSLGIGMSAYLVTLAVFIPISGWVADRFGARRVFMAAIAVFTFASLLCGMATGLIEFIAVRVLQGIGGAMMVPVGRLVVLRTTPKSELLTALAYITWPGLAAPVLGPPLGGFITTHASWPWIFYLNLPLGLIGFFLAWNLVPPEKDEGARPPFDLLGFVSSGGACAALMGAVELVGSRPTPWPLIGCLALAALVLGTIAVRHFRRTAHPLIDLSALKVPTYAVTQWGGSAFRMAIGAVPFLLPLMFQVGWGLNAFDAGMLVLAVFAGNLSMKPMTSAVLRRFGFRTTLIGNGVIIVLTLAGCALLSPSTPTPVLVALLFAGGLCRSMQFTAFNTLAFADIQPGQMNGANTLNSMVQQMSMGLGIAVGAIALQVASLVEPAAFGGMVAAEFRIAFVLVSLLALIAIFDCLRLAPDAGAEITARQKKA